MGCAASTATSKPTGADAPESAPEPNASFAADSDRKLKRPVSTSFIARDEPECNLVLTSWDPCEWDSEDISAWFGTLGMDLQRKYRGVLMPLEGWQMVEWSEEGLLSQGVEAGADVQRLLAARDRALAKGYEHSMGSRQAEPLYRQALERTQNAVGRQHRETAAALASLAECLREQGDRTQAAEVFREAWDLRACFLGPEHADTLLTAFHLARCLKDLGRLADAEAVYRQIVEPLKALKRTTYPTAGHALSNLAYCLSEQGRVTEAEALYRESVQMYEELCQELYGNREGDEDGDGGERTADLSALNINQLFLLACCVKKAGRFEEAEALFGRCLRLVYRKAGGGEGFRPEAEFNAMLICKMKACVEQQGRTFELEAALAAARQRPTTAQPPGAAKKREAERVQAVG
ncbi:hypothetical protein HXX76_014968 [Chlamydomonas incerta]|uniref:Uncharacterized protein n=1 Tax=Chlamydomonas incerta TaxID=51695 RepID=A0A835VS39_CHLIN|nr:hypothetical protein HXX76_014968 [Chlamydomonas incerta]|eukprot:KAG2423808.1 hypothetical protein HXX76_014968 [Chlamydomonas incerta]